MVVLFRVYAVRHVIMMAIALWATVAHINAEELSDAPKVTYDEHIKPILRAKCFGCHNADDREGELDLTSYAALREGGASGVVVKPGDPLNSSLYALINHDDEPSMPPESPKISQELIDAVHLWIDGGAVERASSTKEISARRVMPQNLVGAHARPDAAPMPPRLSLQPAVPTGRPHVISALAVNPWSPLLAVAGTKQVLLYSTSNEELLGVLPFPEGMPEVLRFSRDGSLLLAGGGRHAASGRVVVWNVRTGKRVMEVGDELDTVLAADISPDHTLIALGGPKRVVRVYSTESGQLKYELKQHLEWIYDVQFSPDGVLLATADRNGSIVVSEAFRGAEYVKLKGHEAGMIDLSWRADSNVLGSCGADGAVRLWEMEKGQELTMWKSHPGGAVSVQFTPDGQLVTCGADQITKLWDPQGKHNRSFEQLSGPALQTVFCSHSQRIFTGDDAGAVHIWDAVSGDRLGQLIANPPTLEKRLATATEQLSTLRRQLPTREAAVQAAAANANVISPDVSTGAGTVTAESNEPLIVAERRLQEVEAKISEAEKAIERWRDELEFAERRPQ